MFRIVEVKDTLPPGFELLRHAAEGEAYLMLAALAREWADGSHRFDRPGEALITVYDGDFVVGVGAISRDPRLPDALRMSRFYVRPTHRRRGIGRLLATSLLERPGSAGRTITLSAPQVEAARFWEAVGFVRDEAEGHTDIRLGDYAHA